MCVCVHAVLVVLVPQWHTGCQKPSKGLLQTAKDSVACNVAQLTARLKLVTAYVNVGPAPDVHCDVVCRKF